MSVRPTIHYLSYIESMFVYLYVCLSIRPYVYHLWYFLFTSYYPWKMVSS